MHIVTEEKKYISSYSLEDLIETLKDIGEKGFRAKQIYEWIFTKGADSFEQMNNIPKKLRDYLKENYEFRTIKENFRNTAADGSIKIRFSLYDGLQTEAVLIPSSGRTTVCLSTQTGCNLNCSFCASAKIKNNRNLYADEIFYQFIKVNQLSQEIYKRNLSNIVYMGMGEPFLNYENFIKSVEILCDKKGLNISPNRITVSTAGITDKIKRLAKEELNVNLAISLHSADNDKRTAIMPVNKKYDPESIKDAIKYYYKYKKKRITFEYLLLKDFNDSIVDAKKLAAYCKNFPCKINLIEYNITDNKGFKKTTKDKRDSFYNYLESKNIVVNIRYSKGEDIAAACGQLANR